MRFSLDFNWSLANTLACACVAGCLFLGARGLYGTTEGRYAECARQTMASGHWLDPVLNGHPHWTKPPLTYLAIMGPMRVAGVNTWAARAYLVPFFLLAIWGVWLLGRHLGQDSRLGDLSALVFATSIFPLGASMVISTDVPLTAFLILAQAFFWRAVRTSSLSSLYLVWVSLGLAFMTKGPPSLLVLPAMAVAWRLLPAERRKAVPLFTPGALAVYFVIAASWYVWEAARHPGLLRYWLHDEVINRSASDHFGRNPEFYRNFDVYLPALLFGCWPWGGWLVFVRGKAWWTRLAAFFARAPGRTTSRWSALTAAVRQWPVEKHWSVWAVALPVAVFFLSRSKLPLYVLPLFGPLAVFTAMGLWRAFERDTARLWKGATVLALACWTLFVVVKGVMPLFPGDSDRKALYASIRDQVEDLDAGRLAIFENKHNNGLQFYFQRELPCFESEDSPELRQWLKNGVDGERYLILRRAQTNTLDKCAFPARVEFSALSKKWMLARVSGAQ